MKRTVIVSFVLTTILSSSFATKIPDWIENPGKDYPRSSYYVSVRDSKEKDDAELKAVEGIASVFGQNIYSESEAESKMRSLSLSGSVDSTEIEKSLNQKILRTMNQDDLIGIEIVDSFFDKKANRYYAFAVMDKAKAYSFYEKMILNNDKKARSYISAAEKDSFSLVAYSNLLSAYDYAKINEKYALRLEVINLEKAESVTKSLVKTSQITPLLLESAQNTKISVKIENDTEKLSSAFAKVLSDFGFIVSEQKSRYELWGTLSFFEREISGKGITNVEYSIQCKITDKQNGDELVPWTASGREGAKTAEYARLRVSEAIKKKIANEYSKDFKKSLGEKYE